MGHNWIRQNLDAIDKTSPGAYGLDKIGKHIIANKTNYQVVPNVLAQAKNVVASKVASMRGYDVISNISPVSA